MKNQVLKFDYNKNLIEFETKNENVLINATQMAKLFNKRIDVFLKTEPTKTFINEILITPLGGNNSPLTKDEIIQTNQRGGTYMHRVLAIKFAAWLSPKFDLWVYNTIEQILFGNSRKLDQSLKDSAHRKNEIAELETKLNENEIYAKLQSLKFQERQATKARGKENTLQIELFRENQEPATSN